MSVEKLPVEEIKIPWWNPREVRDPEILNALMESIRKSGVLEPIHVAKIGGEYYCIEGGGRLLAAKQLGIKEIPAKVHEIDQDRAMVLVGELQLTKDDLTQAEKGKYVSMLIRRGLFKNVDEVAEYFGFDRTTVYKWIREYKAAKMEVDETPLPKPVAKELVTLPQRLRKPIIQEVKNLPSPEVQREVVKQVKREIREKMIDEPEEVAHLVKKTIQEVGEPHRLMRFQGAKANYVIYPEDDMVVIMVLGPRGKVEQQVKIPVEDLKPLIKRLQLIASYLSR